MSEDLKQNYLNSFLKHIRIVNSASEHTEDNYRRDINQFFDYLEGEDLLNLDPMLGFSYLNALYEMELSSSSVARKVSALRSFMKFMQLNYGALENPFLNISIRQTQKRLPNFLMFSELENLIMSCEEDDLGIRNRVFIELMYACGLRVSEACNIKLSDLDLESRTLIVTGKGDKTRQLFFYQGLVNPLDKYINEVRPNLLKDKNHDYLFLSNRGTQLSVRGAQYLLEKQGEKANLRMRLHPHILRHTFATHMLDRGASLRVVQALLGHESISTTQVYTHVTMDRLKKSYESAMEKIKV